MKDDHTFEIFYNKHPLDEVPPDPLLAFNEADKKMLMDIATTLNVPVMMPVSVYLAFVSGANGLTYISETPDGQPVYSNLWVCIIAETGSGKSAVLRVFFDKWRVRCMVESQSGEGREGAIVPHIMDNMSYRGFLNRLETDPHGVIVLSDELSQFIEDCKDRHFKSAVLTAYTGSPLIRDLVSGTVNIPCPYMTILGATQPEMLSKLFTYNDLARGFGPRFTFVKTVNESPRYRQAGSRGLSTESENRLDAVIGALFTMSHQAELKQLVSFDEEAYELFTQWHNKIENERVRQRRTLLNGMLSRVKDRTLNLSLIFAVLEAVDTADHTPKITKNVMHKAIWMGNALLNHNLDVWTRDFGITDNLPTVEEAVKRALVQYEGELVENDYSMTNERFKEIVPPFLKRQMKNSDFRAFTKMGLEAFTSRTTGKGWKIPNGALAEFKSDLGF